MPLIFAGNLPCSKVVVRRHWDFCSVPTVDLERPTMGPNDGTLRRRWTRICNYLHGYPLRANWKSCAHLTTILRNEVKTLNWVPVPEGRWVSNSKPRRPLIVTSNSPSSQAVSLNTEGEYGLWGPTINPACVNLEKAGKFLASSQ